MEASANNFTDTVTTHSGAGGHGRDRALSLGPARHHRWATGSKDGDEGALHEPTPPLSFTRTGRPWAAAPPRLILILGSCFKTVSGLRPALRIGYQCRRSWRQGRHRQRLALVEHSVPGAGRRQYRAQVPSPVPDLVPAAVPV